MFPKKKDVEPEIIEATKPTGELQTEKTTVASTKSDAKPDGIESPKEIKDASKSIVDSKEEPTIALASKETEVEPPIPTSLKKVELESMTETQSPAVDSVTSNTPTETAIDAIKSKSEEVLLASTSGNTDTVANSSPISETSGSTLDNLVDSGAALADTTVDAVAVSATSIIEATEKLIEAISLLM